MAPQTRFQVRWLTSFLRLPAEIRIMIYHYLWTNAVFIDSEGLQDPVRSHICRAGRRSSNNGEDQDAMTEDRHLFGLLQTCRLIRAEAHPSIFEHLTVNIREFVTITKLHASTRLLLKDVRVLTCSRKRALALDFGKCTKLEVLAIAHRTISRCGMAMEQAMTLAAAGFSQFNALYLEEEAKKTQPNKLVFSALVGIQNASSRRVPGALTKGAAVRVCLSNDHC